MIYALLYDYVDDIVRLRAPFREPHLGLVGEGGSGRADGTECKVELGGFLLQLNLGLMRSAERRATTETAMEVAYTGEGLRNAA